MAWKDAESDQQYEVRFWVDGATQVSLFAPSHCGGFPIIESLQLGIDHPPTHYTVRATPFDRIATESDQTLIATAIGS